MILYHGSERIVDRPQHGIGLPLNDYGRGFYCAESIELAKEWACPKSRDGFANRYELDTQGLQILYLNSDEYNILNWIAILLENRIFAKRSPGARIASDYITKEFLPVVSGYDIICGYRADDSYFAYAKDFLNNVITVRQLAYAMKLGELGEQIVIVSEEAFNRIRYLGYEIADSSIYYPRRRDREGRARKAYLLDCDRDISIASDDLYVMDIVRGKVRNDDARLR